MLQKLNERIQGLIAWVIIILITVTFALFGVDYYMQSRHAANAQAEVNGEPITKQQLEVNYRRARQTRDPSTLTEQSEQKLKKQILDEMIANHVSMQAARKSGFAVSQAQANAAILGIPQFQEDGRFSAERYQQVLSNALFTPETFNNEVQQGMLLNQQRFAFIGSSFVLPTEVERFVTLYMQTRDYQYLTVPASHFLNSASVNEQEVAAYYQAHESEFLAPETVSIAYIQLSNEDIKKQIQPSPEQVKQYYKDNQTNFLMPAQWQVAHILFSVSPDATKEERQSIKNKAEKAFQDLQANPALFEDKVARLSDDKISIKNAGLLPTVVAGESSLDKAFVRLTKAGQISQPIATKHGYEIFKLISYKPAAVKPFAKVKEIIKEQLIAEKLQAEFSNKLEQLTDLTYQTPDTLEPAANALKLPINTTTLFSRSGGSEPITKNPHVVKAAFSHDVLELDNNSDVVQVNNDSVMVLRVHEHRPAKAKPLSEVKSQISETLSRSKARSKAMELGQSILKASDAARNELIKQYNLQWVSVKGATRDTDKAPMAINSLAFSMAKQDSLASVAVNKDDYALIELKAIHNGSTTQLDKEQLANIKLQLEASYGIMDYDLYISSLLEKAKINRNG